MEKFLVRKKAPVGNEITSKLKRIPIGDVAGRFDAKDRVNVATVMSRLKNRRGMVFTSRVEGDTMYVWRKL